ncbi:amidase family protein [Rhodococcus sp. IEGM1300]
MDVRLEIAVKAQATETRIEYLSVDELTRKMSLNQLTAVALVRHLQHRIKRLDKQGPQINAVIELNPDALNIAKALDKERRNGFVRGPLHGIPVLLKDTIDTSDQMQTSAGSLAMIGKPAAQDAFIVQRLRAAGAIILGKTNLSEWAGFRDPNIPDGWSCRGGLTKNPHVLSVTPLGSSSGSAAAVAAGFTPLAVGTETAGSIVAPASINGVVGLKPTVGLLSRKGIVPVSLYVDTPGPMARTVREAALLLNVMIGSDPAQLDEKPLAINGVDYTALMLPDSLIGRRIGFPAKFDENDEAARIDPQFSQALEVMQAAGAMLIPVEFNDPATQTMEAVDRAFSMSIKWELPKYLATRTGLAIQNLEDLKQYNDSFPGVEGYGQSTLAAACDIEFDEQAYNELWQKIQSENAAVIEDVLVTNQLDALLLDVGSPGLNVIPLAGYPSIMMPSGVDDDGVPTSILFFGARWSEATLLALAYGYEQASEARPVPTFKS